MSADVFNPVTVENRIDSISNEIAETVKACDEALIAFLVADAALDLAFAHAFLAHKGAQTEKRYAAEIATAEQRRARDIAYAASKRADRNAKALESRLMGLQSINKSVNSAYNAVGSFR
jgi:predicted transglutaminase-like cysteine proteinase